MLLKYKKTIYSYFLVIFISMAMIWFHLKRFPGTKRHKLTIWGNLKRFPGTKRRIQTLGVL